MNNASSWRQALVRQIAPIYASHPQVAAVILGGSTARGHADQYSAIELGIFWRTPPTDSDRSAFVDRIGADLVRIYPYEPAEEVWCDDYMLGRAAPDQPRSGVLVEVVHSTVESVDRTLDAVLKRYDPDLLKQNVIAGLLDAVPLSGQDLVHHWQDRAAAYPEELAVAVIQAYATIDHFWRWEMWLQRGENLMMLYQTFSQVEQQVLHMLLGLNHVYYFGFKWIDVVTGRCRLGPPELAERLKRVYQVAPADGAQQLVSLVEETYDLVERHVPRIDVTWLRQVFAYRRPTWEQPPPT